MDKNSCSTNKYTNGDKGDNYDVKSAEMPISPNENVEFHYLKDDKCVDGVCDYELKKCSSMPQTYNYERCGENIKVNKPDYQFYDGKKNVEAFDGNVYDSAKKYYDQIYNRPSNNPTLPVMPVEPSTMDLLIKLSCIIAIIIIIFIIARYFMTY